MSMTLEQAIRILHPESKVGSQARAIRKAGYCSTEENGFNEAVTEAILLACEVMQREVERGKLWHDASTAFPPQDGLYYGKKDEANSMYPVRFESGKWTLSNHSDRKVDIKQWAYWDAFDGDGTCHHCGKPLNDGKVD